MKEAESQYKATLQKQVAVMPYFTRLSGNHVAHKPLVAFCKRMNSCFAVFSEAHPTVLGQYFAIKNN